MSTGQSNREESRWELTQGRDPEAGADTEATGTVLPAGFAPQGSLSLPSYSTKDHQPSSGPTYNELGLPHQSPIKEMQHNLGYSNLGGGMFSNEVLSVQMTLV